MATWCCELVGRMGNVTDDDDDDGDETAGQQVARVNVPVARG